MPSVLAQSRFAAALGAFVLAVGAVLRIVIALALAPDDVTLADGALALAWGALDDALTAMVLLAPLWGASALLRPAWLARRGVRIALFGACGALVVFESFVEYFYFEEFDARFNNIAVDYVLYPHEVVGNVFESYDVPLFVALALACGALAAWWSSRWLPELPSASAAWRERVRRAGLGLLVSLSAAGALLVLPREVSANRVVNELAASGPVQLVRAYWSADLDYALYYRTLPLDVARPRAARVLGHAEWPTAGQPSTRTSPSIARGTPSQVVVVLEESLGSDFVGSLGAAKSPCTPELDRWSTEGLWFRNLIATGNRTVRGLEGVLCSFVPLPGDSLVKRPAAGQVATLASVFRATGFDTAFFYGGYGVFDSMKPFMLRNGYQEFVEQPDFPDEAFRTIWGVADEYIFDALVERQLAQRERQRPLFATLLSVSNHKPYRVPPGRPGSEGEPSRTGAVRYADWCLGRYLQRLRDTGLLDDTLVLIVGDHGARVYGAEEIPTRSYRIPALFVGGPTALGGQRIERLCSQIDLAPTLLELCGIAVDAPFFGRSVLGLPDRGGRAFVQHNRDVGLLVDDALVVLRLQNGLAIYRREGLASDSFELVPRASADARLVELADDAAAVFTVAHELYTTRSLALQPAALEASAKARR